MGRICIICGGNKLPTAKLYKFPADAERLQQWLIFCNLSEQALTKSKRICSIHFTHQSFTNMHADKGLNPDAVPTLHPIEVLQESDESDAILLEMLDTDTEMAVEVLQESDESDATFLEMQDTDTEMTFHSPVTPDPVNTLHSSEHAEHDISTDQGLNTNWSQMKFDTPLIPNPVNTLHYSEHDHHDISTDQGLDTNWSQMKFDTPFTIKSEKSPDFPSDMNRTTISCVRWVDFSDHMLSTFLDVYANGLYTDVTLIPADGGQLTACRMVLSMASKFFEDIFRTALTTMPASCIVGGAAGPNDTAQDVAVMIPDVSFAILKHVLHFIYTGEVHMNAREMSDFFEACQLFGLKGLDYQNGNINGVKIAGSNIITPEQYELEDLQDSYAEGSMVDDGDGVAESEEGVGVEATVGGQVASEGEFQEEEEDVQKDGDTETETVNQYYEMDVNMVDFEPGTSNQGSNDQTVVSGNQSNTSDVETSGESSGLCKKRLKNVEYGDKLDEAINTIIQGGASFRTASIQYGIPKTVLWRKAVKAPNYKADRFELPSPRKEAIEALKAGEKLLNISKRFDIPLSTLHRDKIKLFSEGALPDNVMLKQRDKGSDFKDRVLEAAHQCVAGLMSQSEASKLYRLPKTTIWRKIKALRGAAGSGSMQMDGGNTSVEAVDVKPELIEVLESHEDGEMESEEQLEPDYVVLV